MLRSPGLYGGPQSSRVPGPWRFPGQPDRADPEPESRSFINAERRGVFGRVQIEADDVGSLGLKIGIVACHVSLPPERLRPASCQTRCTAAVLTPSAAASLRQLQRVEPRLGGGLRVATKIRARSLTVSTDGFYPG